MGTGLLAMGVLHFVRPAGFDSIIPDEIPLPKRILTLASGVAELAVGTGLMVPKTRRAASLAAIALFIAVFPANINTVRVVKDKQLAIKMIAVARLPFQIPLITTAWRTFKRSA
ncbi:Uncharacterized membrane protein [Propionibacterium cyclohexanicum]|uniref:Uncharacterized membrane protein n=2 Tax=Propionibacterium cyclohexanicum TaxID=64702 RepID=A0A1H9TKM9_9ACTN|nr:Uncharacterized membrane protein [Propionibacterium cyclohexanicum]